VRVPISIQTSIITKILSFERRILNAEKKEINILILYQSKAPSSGNAKKEAQQSFTKQSSSLINGKTIRTLEFDLSSSVKLSDFMKSQNIDCVFIMPLIAFDINSISNICQNYKILSFTSVPDYMKNGISVAIDNQGDKPQIIINLAASKKEGADFSSQLLKLSKII
jgi:hypothetical protein